MNSSKKIYYISHLSVHGFLYVCVELTLNFILFFWLGQIFSASRLDIPSAWQLPQC
ncbi:hypothetical protein ACJW30_11G129600 [Castanea mollissima]